MPSLRPVPPIRPPRGRQLPATLAEPLPSPHRPIARPCSPARGGQRDGEEGGEQGSPGRRHHGPAAAGEAADAAGKGSASGKAAGGEPEPINLAWRGGPASALARPTRSRTGRAATPGRGERSRGKEEVGDQLRDWREAAGVCPRLKPPNPCIP